MNPLLLRQVVEELQRKGVVFDEGLSDIEIHDIEQKNNFSFPPDLKAFLQFTLPVSYKPDYDDEVRELLDWRGDSVAFMEQRRNWRLEGFIWQLEHDDEFWLRRWGTRPEDLEKAKSIIRRDYATAPVLIPFFYRSVPNLPCIAANPVISVAGVDIIHYGSNLLNYLDHEFHLGMSIPRIKSPQYIEFWDDFLSQNR